MGIKLQGRDWTYQALSPYSLSNNFIVVDKVFPSVIYTS